MKTSIPCSVGHPNGSILKWPCTCHFSTVSMVCGILFIASVPLPALAQAASATTHTYDGFFLVAVIAMVIGLVLFDKGDDKTDGTGARKSRTGVSGMARFFIVVGAIGLYATHGNTWTFKGLAQAAGMYANQPYAPRPFFDERAANVAMEAHRLAIAEQHRIDGELVALGTQIDNARQREAFLIGTFNSIESQRHALRIRRDTLMAVNIDLSICLKAIDATVDIGVPADSQKYDSGEQVWGVIGVGVCMYQYHNSQSFQARVERVLGELRDLQIEERRGSTESDRIRIELASLRKSVEDINGRIAALRQRSNPLL